MSLDIDFKGKRVLVTAGTKGLGKAVVGLLNNSVQRYSPPRATSRT